MNPAQTASGGASLSGGLFVLSLGLLTTALLFDLVDLSTGTGALGLLAYWLAAAGVAAGLAAGLCRLWRLAPTGAVKSPWHLTALPGFFKAVAITLCAGGWSLRTVEGDVPAAGLTMAVLGVAFALASRFLRAAPHEDGERVPAEAGDSPAGVGAGAPDRPAGEPAARGF